MTPPDIPLLLSRLPLFQELAVPQLEALARDTRLVEVPKGDILFHKGDESHGFFVVLFGQIKLAIASSNGHEKVVDVIGSRQSFGEAVMFMGCPYPVSAQAISDSRLLRINRQTVFDLLTSDAKFARAMLAGLSIRLHSLVGDVASYSLRTGLQRVIGYLLQQAAEQGASEESAGVTLPIFKQVLASRLNLTPESLSRVLHDLESAGLIEVHGRQIMIHNLQLMRDFDP
jgi:CRP-like cAMP-binding protein